MALRWLWVALPRLSRLDVGCSTFDVRCSGPRTVPVRSGSEWAWVLDLLAPSCPRGRCEPGRFAVRNIQHRTSNIQHPISKGGAKPPKATAKPYTRHIVGIYSGVYAYYMPSIWLCGGFGWLCPAFRDWMLDVRRSMLDVPDREPSRFAAATRARRRQKVQHPSPFRPAANRDGSRSGTSNIERRTSNLQSRKAGQSHPKPPQSHIVGIY